MEYAITYSVFAKATADKVVLSLWHYPAKHVAMPRVGVTHYLYSQ